MKPGDRATIKRLTLNWAPERFGGLRCTILDVVGDHVRVAFDKYETDVNHAQIVPWLHRYVVEVDPA